MRKSSIRKLALINCFLFMCSNYGIAAANNSEQTETLDEVVVTSTPLEQYLVTTSVITDKDIAKSGARNLADALATVPGLNFHRGKKNANQVDIRGSSLSYCKIYIDGVFVNPLSKVNGSDAVDLNMVPVDSIAKIEIIKGPAPVIYGTDAIGGVILITTKNGKDYPGGKVSVSGGSFGTANGYVSYGGGNEKFNFYLNAGSEDTDGSRDNGDKKDTFFNTKANWKLSDSSSLTFLGSYSTTDKNMPNAVDPVDGHIVSSKSAFWPGLNNWQYRDWEKTNLALDFTHKVNSDFNYDFRIYRYTEKQGLWANGANYDSAAVTPNGSGLVKVGNAANGYSINRWNLSGWDSFINGMDLTANWKLSNVHNLTFGTTYYNLGWKKTASPSPSTDPNDPDNYYWQMFNNQRKAFYLQDNIVPTDKLTVTLGVRRDVNTVTNAYDPLVSTLRGQEISWDNNSPTINVVYQCDPRNTLRTSYGETCSFPLVNQMYSSVAGNPNLKPEKAKNYELGYKHVFDNTLTGDIALFENDITDKIDTVTVGGVKTYENLEWAKIKGIELELDKTFSDRLTGFANFSYLLTSTVDTSNHITNIKYTPRDHLNYGLSYNAGKGYNLRLSGTWVTERYTADSTGSDTRTGNILYSKLPGYHVMDFEVKRQVTDNFDWYVSVYNIFDKQYQDELFYPADGRCVVVGVDYSF